MLPDRVSNPVPLTYESGALPIARLYVVQCQGIEQLAMPCHFCTPATPAPL